MKKVNAPWELKRKLVVKAEEAADPQFGCKPDERIPENYIKFGIIPLDKPSGPSSHEVSAWVKHIMGLERAGHGGTLEA